MSDTTLLIDFHCQPHVKHWLSICYGSPVCLPRRSTFRNTFYSTLCKSFYPHNQFFKQTYTEVIQIRVHKDELQEHGHTINPALQHHLHNVIDEQLRNQLFIYVWAAYVNGETVDDAIRAYQNQMGFKEEVFSFDAIRSAYFRRKKIYTKISAHLPLKKQSHVSKNS